MQNITDSCIRVKAGGDLPRETLDYIINVTLLLASADIRFKSKSPILYSTPYINSFHELLLSALRRSKAIIEHHIELVNEKF